MDFFFLPLSFVFSSVGAVVLPALIYVAVVLMVAILLSWGNIGTEDSHGTRVLKLPGGGLLASLPIPELILIGIALVNPAVNLAVPLMTTVLLGLAAFAFIRFTAWILTHFMVMFGSMSARLAGLDFSLECMDNRCDHGLKGSGNHLHNWACGGFTLLTALGFAPLVIVPVLFGLAPTFWGTVVFALTCFPYPFVVSKLLAGRFGDSGQVFIKGLTDFVMFVTEGLGWIIGSITLSIFAWRPMWPKISKTDLH